MKETYPVSDISAIKVLLGGSCYEREWKEVTDRDRLEKLFEAVDRLIEWGYVDERFWSASGGIPWAVNTLRTKTLVAIWLKCRTLDELLSIMEEVSNHVRCMAEVPYYLNTIPIQVQEADGDMRQRYQRVVQPTDRREQQANR